MKYENNRHSSAGLPSQKANADCLWNTGTVIHSNHSMNSIAYSFRFVKGYFEISAKKLLHTVCCILHKNIFRYLFNNTK